MLNTCPNKLCVVDVEADFEYGLQYYHEGFKLKSLAFLIVKDREIVQKIYTEDLVEAKSIMEQALENSYIFVVWNLTYEYGVFLTQFGLDISDNVIDAMRVYMDATSRKNRYSKEPWGLSLSNATWEMCGVKDYKNRHLQPLIDSGIAKNMKQAHAHVAELPSDKLEEYNIDDVMYTWKVFNKSCAVLDRVGYDWRFLHSLYIADAVRNVKAYIRGIKIDREMLYANYQKLVKEEANKRANFMVKYEKYIDKAINTLLRDKEDKLYISRKKSAVYPEKIKRPKLGPLEFNIASTQHKIYLVAAMGLEAKLFTKTGNPSFQKNHLHQWGELGQDLKEVSKLARPIMEAEKVLALSEDTGRVHALVKPALTITGRSISGGA